MRLRYFYFLFVVFLFVLGGYTGYGSAYTSSNGVALLRVEKDGTVQIKEGAKGDGPLLVSNSRLLSLTVAGSNASAETFFYDRAQKKLVMRFKNGIEVVLTVKTGSGAWLFTCESVKGKDVEAVTVGPFITAFDTLYRGDVLNMCSDDSYGVCARSCGWKDATVMREGPAVVIAKDRVHEAWSFGLVAAPSVKLTAALQEMTRLSGVPISTAGGAWAIESEAANQSYIFADISPVEVDAWAEFLNHAAISILHVHGWWKTLGQYAVNAHRYPAGLKDLERMAQRLHAAGLKTGMHTLSSNIEVKDLWVKNAAGHVKDFIATRSYTLARPLSAQADALYIVEEPDRRQDAFLTYSGSGNILRIGDELIQYKGINRTPPYGFFGLTRAWGGTTAATHAQGAPADWLRQRYMALYPKAGSAMLTELAANIAKVREALGAEMFYFDGMEGCGTFREMDAARFAIFDALKASPLNECSYPTANCWWFQSRIGTIDRPIWNMKRFNDVHVSKIVQQGKANLLRPQMGWWAPRIEDNAGQGHFWNDMEYFGAKTAAIDGVMSLQGVRVNGGALPFEVWRQATILGWYERARKAKAFTHKAMKLLNNNDWEYRLRQDDEGVWRLHPMMIRKYKDCGVSDKRPTWTFAAKGQSHALIRVEALFSADPHAAQNSAPLTADPINKPPIAGETDALTIPPNGAFLLRVRGNGGSQVLHVRAESQRAYLGGISDQFVPLDFTGEKTIVLPVRERDETDTTAYVAYGIALDTAHLASIKTEVTGDDAAAVHVSGLWGVKTAPIVIRKPVVKINEQPFELPFDLNSGEYAEFEDNVWTRFRKGMILEQKIVKGEPPVLVKGENAISFSANDDPSGRARAEVTIIGVAPRGFSALRADIDEAAKRELAFEAMEPIFYAPEKGVTSAPFVKVRPEEKAWLSFCLSGEAVNPKIKVGSQEVVFQTAIHVGERLDCQDGLNWVLQDKSCKTIKTGKLPKRMSGVTGVRPMTISAGGKMGELLVRVVKHYGAP